MNAANAKWIDVVRPGVIKDNASFTGVEIDTLGYDYLEVAVQLGATDIAMAALKVGEYDTTGGDSGAYTNITGLVFGTSTGSAGSASTLPSATDDDKIFLFNIDLKGRQRFLMLTATAGDGSTGSYLSAIGRLTQAEKVPSTAAQYGASQVLQAPAYT